MRRIIWILVLAVLGWYGWGKYEAHIKAQDAAEAAGRSVKPAPAKERKAAEPAVSFFTCDGRNSCVQMTSCDEARYFVKNCPGMNSGASGEGVPSCEKQWCKK